MSTRITKKKLEEAARLAKETGLRVTLGDFVFEPFAPANDRRSDAKTAQEKIDAMARK